MDDPTQVTRHQVATDVSAASIVTFGSFRVHLVERWLEKDGRPIRMSERAIDVLIILIERAGTIVSKTELLARVWPNEKPDENSLRAYVAAIRRALGDGETGARYVATVSGQGYCFVARTSFAELRSEGSKSTKAQTHNLPPRSTTVIGREKAVRELSDSLLRERFVSIVGPGGIGKTTVALSAAYVLLNKFEGAAFFFDLGSIRDAALVPNVIAATLGLVGRSDNAADVLVAFLRDKRTLLILDCCEHVIETSAALAETLYKLAPQVYILATSREALRVEGETIYRLPPLAIPPDEAPLSAEQALRFSAIQLFVERATASAGGFDLTEANAPLIAEICRKLDGIALAIELASSRAGTFGLKETISLLSTQSGLLWQGRRTALPRQQTLRATLDWSYNLLMEREREVFRRLSVFSGTFTLDAAIEVSMMREPRAQQVLLALESLVAKSLLNTMPGPEPTRYRLLDTSRAYAAEQLSAAGEQEATAQRHASYFVKFLEQFGRLVSDDSKSLSFADVAEQFGNIRSALVWCFSESGDLPIGVALAAASMPVLLELSLFQECQLWATRAIGHLEVSERNTEHDLNLHAALGLAVMHSAGNIPAAESCFVKALAIAEQIGDVSSQIRLIERLHVFYLRSGNHSEALILAARGEALASAFGDPVQRAHMLVIYGMSCYLAGYTALARTSIESALVQLPRTEPAILDRLNFDYLSRARITLARILWVQGYPDRAETVVREALTDVIRLGHSAKLCTAILWAHSLFVWDGEAENYEIFIDKLLLDSEEHSLAPYRAFGEAARALVCIERNQVEVGLPLLQRAMLDLRKQHFRPHTDLTLPLAVTLAKIGDHRGATTAIDGASGEFVCMLPEVLRIKAEVLLTMHNPDLAEVESCLGRSLRMARDQSALAWELRTATSLARLWAEQGRHEEARELLSPIHARITEGFNRKGVKTASELLQRLNSTMPDRALSDSP